MDNAQPLEDRLLRLEGLQEIHRIIAEYSHGADKRDLGRFLSIWHDDAVWDVGVARFTGHDEIAMAIQQQWAAQPVMAHWTANLSIDLPVGSTRARAEVATDTMTQLSSGEWLQSAGTYYDIIEMRDGRWAFAQRKATAHFSLVVTNARHR